MAMVGTRELYLRSYAKMLEGFEWEHEIRNSLIVRNLLGVCIHHSMEFPLHQIIGKVAPAIALDVQWYSNHQKKPLLMRFYC